MRRTHDVVLFEGEGRLGGHANTVTVDYDGAEIPVDTGFIVCNELNYPNFLNLLEALSVKTVASDMSFSVSDPDGYEWSSNGLSGLFAWKRNMTNPGFLCMLGDIVRFSAKAREDLRESRLRTQTLEEYVGSLGLSRGFLRNYLLPMGAAIWSTPERDMLRYPAASFLRFFDNHRLLHAKRPQWLTVEGGSRTYVAALRAELGERVRSGDPVVSVKRDGVQVVVRTQSGAEDRFDQVVMACHSDESLALIDDASREEAAALGAVRYEPNVAYLHRDPRLMPKRAAAWASWNYLRHAGADDKVCVSYWMNRLQAIDEARPLFVTLNPAQAPDPALTYGRFEYSHPQFDGPALAAQTAVRALQGRNRLWFAGAWLGYGFHEDGLVSGLDVAAALGAPAPWTVTRRHDVSPAAPAPLGAPNPVAA
jgi:predicted NAD/FAD-binding protein